VRIIDACMATGYDALTSANIRLCPGVHYAKASLFIAIASILATFNISLAKDESGNDIIPLAESENNVI
jgi:hypothetical protein